jgi:hydroxyethylthiazole kinase
MATAITGCFAAVRADALADAAAFALAAFGVAAEDAAGDANGPGTFHARLYDALYGLTPESLDERRNIEEA